MSNENKVPDGFSVRDTAGGGFNPPAAEEKIHDAGVGQAIRRELSGRARPAANARAAYYQQMAREALSSVQHETRGTNEMRIDELIGKTEADIRTLKRAALDVREFADGEGRHLTRDERAQVGELEERIEVAKRDLDRFHQVMAEDEEIDRRSRETYETEGGRQLRESRSRNTALVSVSRNERTYHRGKDERDEPGSSFLADVVRAHKGDWNAQERLSRHMSEELIERPWLKERASSTVSFPGMVVPQYAVQDVAPAVAAARPLADAMTSKQLPESGMTVSIPVISQSTSASLQPAENTAVTSQDIQSQMQTASVQTAEGWVQLSRQALERGTLTEEVTTADLLARVATTLDSTLLYQATNGLAASATSMTYSPATPDLTTGGVPSFLKQLPSAQNLIELALLNRAQPGVVIMSPRRWNWLTAATSSAWPTLSGSNQVPVQSGGVQLTGSYGGVRGVLPNGMKIVVDGNISTAASGTAATGGSQDHVFVLSAQEDYLYEPPERAVMIRADQPAATSLGVLLVAYEYFAYSFKRYTAGNVLINGTGLGTPAFT